MARKKVKLAFIVNDNARKASLKKRKAGLTKKVNDLSILCDVKACLIIYNPDDADPLVWPSPEIACGLIERFFSLPEIERSKKSVNQETYFKDRLGKVSEMLAKTQKKSRELQNEHLMFQINGGGGRTVDDLTIGEMFGLVWFSREKIGDLRKRLDFFQHIPFRTPPPQNPNADFSSDPMGAADAVLRDMHQMEQWFQVNGNTGAPTVGNSQYNNTETPNPFPYERFHGVQLNVNANVDRFLEAQANVYPNIERFLGPQANVNPNVEGFLGPQASVNPNVERFLGPQASVNPNVDRSFTNLVLGLSPHQQQDSYPNMGLGLGLPSRYDLAGGSSGPADRFGADEASSSLGPMNRYGADGANSLGPMNRYGVDGASSSFGPTNRYGADGAIHYGADGGSGGGGGEPEMPFGLFGEGGGDMGMNYDVSRGWPNINNFTQ